MAVTRVLKLLVLHASLAAGVAEAAVAEAAGALGLHFHETYCGLDPLQGGQGYCTDIYVSDIDWNDVEAVEKFATKMRLHKARLAAGCHTEWKLAMCSDDEAMETVASESKVAGTPFDKERFLKLTEVLKKGGMPSEAAAKEALAVATSTWAPYQQRVYEMLYTKFTQTHGMIPEEAAKKARATATAAPPPPSGFLEKKEPSRLAIEDRRP